MSATPSMALPAADPSSPSSSATAPPATTISICQQDDVGRRDETRAADQAEIAALQELLAVTPTTVSGAAQFSAYISGRAAEGSIGHQHVGAALRALSGALAALAGTTAAPGADPAPQSDAALIGAFIASCVAAQVRPIVFDYGGSAGKHIQFLGPFDATAWWPMRRLEQRIVARPSAHALLLAILPEAPAAKYEPRKWVGPGKYRIAGTGRWFWCRLDEERGIVELLARRDRGLLARMPFASFDRQATHVGLGMRGARRAARQRFGSDTNKELAVALDHDSAKVRDPGSASQRSA